jgi:hypothetical protein
MTDQHIVEHFRGMDTSTKLELLHRLWEELTKEVEARPPTEAERSYVEDRLRDIDADPRPERTWDDVRSDLSRRK